MEILDILFDTGVYVNDPRLCLLSGAVCMGNYEFIALLLKRGVNPHLPPPNEPYIWNVDNYRPIRWCRRWPVDLAIKTKEERIEHLLISTGHRIAFEEMQRLLLVSIMRVGFSKVRKVIEACARTNSITVSAVLQTFGTSLGTGLVILLNQGGLECLKWLIDNEV